MSHQTPYTHKLADDEYEGTINGITIHWQASAKKKIDTEVVRTQQPHELLKAITEHFTYLAAHRLGHKDVKILAPPHTFSVDSATGQAKQEPCEHVSARLTDGPRPSGNLHVYIEGKGKDWHSLYALGETLFVRGGKQPDPDCSKGWWPGSKTPRPTTGGSQTTSAASSAPAGGVASSEAGP